MLIWRLYIGRRKAGVVVRWLGPCHTYTLWPHYRCEDRANW